MGRLITFGLVLACICVAIWGGGNSVQDDDLDWQQLGEPLKPLAELSDDELKAVMSGEGLSEPLTSEQNEDDTGGSETVSTVDSYEVTIVENLEIDDVVQVVAPEFEVFEEVAQQDVEQIGLDEVVILEVERAPKCFLVGELRELSDIQAIQRQVEAFGADVEPVTRFVEELGPYMVYVVPQPSANKAIDIVEELSDIGIDSIIIRDGALLNGVSLGVFRSDENSAALARRMRDAGYDVKRRRMSFERKLYSLYVRGFEATHTENNFWEEVSKSYTGITVEEKSCEEVASLGNFQ